MRFFIQGDQYTLVAPFNAAAAGQVATFVMATNTQDPTVMVRRDVTADKDTLRFAVTFTVPADAPTGQYTYGFRTDAVNSQASQTDLAVVTTPSGAITGSGGVDLGTQIAQAISVAFGNVTLSVALSDDAVLDALATHADFDRLSAAILGALTAASDRAHADSVAVVNEVHLDLASLSTQLAGFLTALQAAFDRNHADEVAILNKMPASPFTAAGGQAIVDAVTALSNKVQTNAATSADITALAQLVTATNTALTALKASEDAVKGSTDAVKGSVDLVKTSTDAVKTSVDATKASVDALKPILQDLDTKTSGDQATETTLRLVRDSNAAIKTDLDAIQVLVGRLTQDPSLDATQKLNLQAIKDLTAKVTANAATEATLSAAKVDLDAILVQVKLAATEATQLQVRTDLDSILARLIAGITTFVRRTVSDSQTASMLGMGINASLSTPTLTALPGNTIDVTCTCPSAGGQLVLSHSVLGVVAVENSSDVFGPITDPLTGSARFGHRLRGYIVPGSAVTGTFKAEFLNGTTVQLSTIKTQVVATAYDL